MVSAGNFTIVPAAQRPQTHLPERGSYQVGKQERERERDKGGRSGCFFKNEAAGFPQQGGEASEISSGSTRVRLLFWSGARSGCVAPFSKKSQTPSPSLSPPPLLPSSHTIICRWWKKKEEEGRRRHHYLHRQKYLRAFFPLSEPQGGERKKTHHLHPTHLSELGTPRLSPRWARRPPESDGSRRGVAAAGNNHTSPAWRSHRICAALPSSASSFRGCEGRKRLGERGRLGR